MDVRERLVELLNEVQETGVNEIPAGFGCTREYVKNEKVASHLISHGVTVQEWISVKEPPKERGEYLCYFNYEPESPDVICQNTYYGSGLWMSESSRVTHWQYLPQPPKGERTMKENCAECKYHDFFWEGSGCVLLNGMEQCRYEPKEKDISVSNLPKGE